MNITINYSDDAMWGDAGDDGHNVSASFEKFENSVAAAIAEIEPAATVTFCNGINDTVEVDGQRDSGDAEWVSQVMGNVWESFDWAVQHA